LPKRRSFDRWLLLTTLLLGLCGFFLVGSASHYVAMSLGKDPTYFLVRHGAFLFVGIATMAGTMALPLDRLDRRIVVVGLLAVSIVSLLLVLAMPAAGGAHRWFRVGPIGLQPSELAKITTVVFLAYVLSRRTTESVNDPRKTLLPVAALVGAMAFLIVIEPDLGSAVMVLVTCAIMLFVAGLKWRHIGTAAGLGALFIALAILAQPYRMKRMEAFLHPESDAHGSGFQLAQSLIAVGSGGVTGVGFGQSQQKAFYLPAPHTDFVFSVLGEEMGLIGTLVLIAGVGVFTWRGLRASVKAPTSFASYLALGGTLLIVLQSLIHMGVCVGLLPTKGLPFPLISYGGSSLVASFAVIGVVLNVSQHSN